MVIDVTVQANGYDPRQRHQTVRLPPEVLEVRYNAGDHGRVQVATGDRARLAELLRRAGYDVLWDDPNPARALGSRTSPAKAAAARANGARSAGGRKSTSHLVTAQPILGDLLALTKGELIDALACACAPGVRGLRRAVREAFERRQQALPGRWMARDDD